MAVETKILPEVDSDVTENDGKAHYVRIKALIDGGPVVALCGKKYVPKIIAEAWSRPLCPMCAELYAILGLME